MRLSAVVTAFGETGLVTPGIPARAQAGAAERATPAASQADLALQAHALQLLERVRVEITRGNLPVAVTAAVAVALRHGLDGAAGHLQVQPVAPSANLASFAAAEPLTAAEQEVLFLIRQGRSAKQIASARNSCVSTVRTQIASILGKMNCRSQRELLAHTCTSERPQLHSAAPRLPSPARAFH